MKFFLFLQITIGMLLPISLSAQTSDDSLAQVLVKRHILLNTAKMTMPGYRVQVYYGSNRAKANEIRTEFLKNSNGISAYLIYQQPNFKVRLGDFKTRLQAQELLDKSVINYPGAFIVRDEVKLPEIK